MPSSLWRMTFGLAPRIEWDARIKGRGVAGVGEAPGLIHHAQLAWMPAPERRRYAMTGPRPPAGSRTWNPPRGSTAGCSARADGSGGQPAASTRTAGRDRAAPAGDAPAGDPDSDGGGQDLIVGIADAARYLGYDKPGSFRRARTRHPIPGETRTHGGRPCWTPRALRSWQSRRKIAGNRTPAGEHG